MLINLKSVFAVAMRIVVFSY